MNLEELNKKLEQIEDKLIAVERPFENRIYLLCEADKVVELNKFLFKDLALRFVITTGIDSDDCFEVLYHYCCDSASSVVTVKAFIRDRENPSIESIAPFLPGAEWAEREIHDVLGIDFKNHPNLKRLILSDDWPEGVYPLRKEVKK